MKCEISEAELVIRSHNGTVYVCRSCHDRFHKIVMIRYVPGGKHEVIPDTCEDCIKILNQCPSCRKP